MIEPNWFEFTKCYNNKKSFGDCDVVLNKKYLKKDWLSILINEFELINGNFLKNSEVFSFSYNELQIDLIMTKDDEYRTSLVYFSYNDVSNLAGRLAKKLSVKYGHKGLELVIKNDDNVLGTMILTKDTKTIHEFLDLNHEEYIKGFDELEDMFIWIANSKYFNKDIYLLHNRNATSRVRDKKRATYNAFLTWCETKEFKNNHHYDVISEFGGYNIRQPFFDELVCTKFPQARDFYNTILDKFHSSNLFKEKFNGKIINELTRLSGIELGHFISYAKEQIELTNLKSLFINSSVHTCNQMILSLYNHYINGWTHWLNVPEDDAIRFIRG